MVGPDFGDVAAWGFIFGAIAFMSARHLGDGPAIGVAMLVALTTKATLLRLT